MSLFKAIKNKFRKISNDAAESLKDPTADGQFAIEDSKKQVGEFRKAIAKALAQNKTLEDQETTARENVKKFQNIAKAALEAGNENDARTALEKKAEFESRSKTLKSEITKNNQIIESQRKQLAAAESKIVKAENNHKMLVARMEGAKARKGLVEAHTNFNSGDNPLAALDDLEKAVTIAENEAEAFEELAGVNEVSLEDKYNNAGSNVDSELEKLRASLK